MVINIKQNTLAISFLYLVKRAKADMDSNILVGVAGGLLAVIMIFKEIRLFLKDRKTEDTKCAVNCKVPDNIDIGVMAQQVSSMHSLHSKTDDDGVPMVYFRRSFEDAIKDLTSVLRKMDSNQNRIMDRLGQLVKEKDK